MQQDLLMLRDVQLLTLNLMGIIRGKRVNLNENTYIKIKRLLCLVIVLVLDYYNVFILLQVVTSFSFLYTKCLLFPYFVAMLITGIFLWF